MRYALMVDDIVINVIECAPELIANVAARSGASGYVEAAHGSAHATCEPGGKLAGAKSAPREGARIDAGALAVTRAKDTPRAEVDAAELKSLDLAREAQAGDTK